jgi:hypothetical protein
MYADGERELMDFAMRLNLRPEWVQRSAGSLVHFDLTESRRALAIRYGAVEQSARHMVRHMQQERARRMRLFK